MKIDINVNPSQFGFDSVSKKQENDPFDINLNITSLKLNQNDDKAPVTSVSLCTPGCGMTGTGNSFCCR